jgi:hypothetical protein
MIQTQSQQYILYFVNQFSTFLQVRLSFA